MKKLMILGGSKYILPVIKTAHELGCYVITCDYLPDNIAHRYSDEYRNISIIDKEAVLSTAQELHIDGIMSFACDPGVVTAAYVAEKMRLPSAGSYEAVQILQNKGRFRSFLKEHGFKVPTAKSYRSVDEAVKDAPVFHWPVIVKPTDSAGSKGVTKVENPDDLEKSIRYALSFSHGNEFIIEDYLQQVGSSSDADSFSIDGILKFISFDCQLFDRKAKNPYTPAAYGWPSSISKEKQTELTNEIQRLISLLGLKTSIYNIETRECTDGNAYIMECSPRGGGNRLAEMAKYTTGVDLIRASVQAAIGEKVTGVVQREQIGAWAEIILHSSEKGFFKELWISDDIKEYVVERDLWIEYGAAVGGFSAANEAIGTLVLQFDTEEKMKNVLSEQNKYIQVRLS